MTHNYQKNEVKDLGGAQPIFGPFDLNVIAEGMSKHAFYTRKVIGALFNEDGTYAGPDVEAERSYCGTPIPPYTGSFGLNLRIFKNFRIDVLAEWATGHSMFNNTKLFANYLGTAFGLGANTGEYQDLQELLGLADWGRGNTPLTPGTSAYEGAAHEYAKLNYDYDSNYIEEADYFKIREVSISYSFKDLIPKVYGTRLISDLVVGVSGRNLWTTTKYSGADVELNFDGSRGLIRGQDFLTLMQPRVYNVWFRVSL